MKKYKSKKRDSGVVAYDFEDESIIIQFKDKEKYLYDYNKPGKEHVEAMKRLAEAGDGLSTYINRYVRGNFSEKLTWVLHFFYYSFIKRINYNF